MGCKAPFDLEAIETLAVTTEAGVFDLSPTAWLVLQAAMSVIANHWNWCGEWGNGEALTDAERTAIDEIVREVQQVINEAVMLGTLAEQDADNVDIDGGTIEGVAIGLNVADEAVFTDVLIRPLTGNTTPFRLTAEMQLEIVSTVYGDQIADFPALILKRAKGTESAPDPVIAGNLLGSINFAAWGSSGFNNGALIRANAAENWTTTARGTRLVFYTAQNGGTAVDVAIILHNDKRLEVEGTLDHDGSLIGLNGATPVAKGTITGSRGGNAALASLLTYLASRGDIIDNSTA